MVFSPKFKRIVIAFAQHVSAAGSSTENYDSGVSDSELNVPSGNKDMNFHAYDFNESDDEDNVSSVASGEKGSSSAAHYQSSNSPAVGSAGNEGSSYTAQPSTSCAEVPDEQS